MKLWFRRLVWRLIAAWAAVRHAPARPKAAREFYRGATGKGAIAMDHWTNYVMAAFSVIVFVMLILALSGCVGMVSDYATAANAYGAQATRNTIVQLQQKHDTELAGYLAAVCGQPRAGALMRRYRTPEEMASYVDFCRTQSAFGFLP